MKALTFLTRATHVSPSRLGSPLLAATLRLSGIIATNHTLTVSCMRSWTFPSYSHETIPNVTSVLPLFSCQSTTMENTSTDRSKWTTPLSHARSL